MFIRAKKVRKETEEDVSNMLIKKREKEKQLPILKRRYFSEKILFSLLKI